MKDYVGDKRRWDSAKQHKGHVEAISIDSASAEMLYHRELSVSGDPDDLFNELWTRTVLEQALQRAEILCPEHFDKLRVYLQTKDGPEYAEIAAELGSKPNTIAQKVKRLRRVFRDAIYDIVSDTVTDPSDIDEEIRLLIAGLNS